MHTAPWAAPAAPWAAPAEKEKGAAAAQAALRTPATPKAPATSAVSSCVAASAPLERAGYSRLGPAPPLTSTPADSAPKPRRSEARGKQHRRSSSDPLSHARLAQLPLLSGLGWKYSRRKRKWLQRWFVLVRPHRLRWFRSELQAVLWAKSSTASTSGNILALPGAIVAYHKPLGGRQHILRIKPSAQTVEDVRRGVNTQKLGALLFALRDGVALEQWRLAIIAQGAKWEAGEQASKGTSTASLIRQKVPRRGRPDRSGRKPSAPPNESSQAGESRSASPGTSSSALCEAPCPAEIAGRADVSQPPQQRLQALARSSMVRDSGEEDPIDEESLAIGSVDGDDARQDAEDSSSEDGGSSDMDAESDASEVSSSSPPHPSNSTSLTSCASSVAPSAAVLEAAAAKGGNTPPRRMRHPFWRPRRREVAVVHAPRAADTLPSCTTAHPSASAPLGAVPSKLPPPPLAESPPPPPMLPPPPPSPPPPPAARRAKPLKLPLKASAKPIRNQPPLATGSPSKSPAGSRSQLLGATPPPASMPTRWSAAASLGNSSSSPLLRSNSDPALPRSSRESEIAQKLALGIGDDAQRDPNVNIAIRGLDFTETWFSAREVRTNAQLSEVVLFLQQLWGRMLSVREDDWIEMSRRPFIFDDAMALLIEQTARYMQHTVAEHRLAVRFELMKDASGMHLRMRTMPGQPTAASFSDQMDLLAMLTDAMELRSVMRRAFQRDR